MMFKAYLDHARAIGAYLVILGHLIPRGMFERQLIYAFHMPLFFFISGMLHKENGSWNIKKYVKTLIIPCFFYVFFLWSLSGILWFLDVWDFGQRYGMEKPDTLLGTYWITLKQNVLWLFYDTKSSSGPCWFLISLFTCKLLMNVYSQIKANRAVILLITLVGFVAFSINHVRFLFLQSTFMALPLFFLGYYFRQIDYIFSFGNKWSCIFYSILFFVIMMFVSIYNGNVSMLGVKFGTHSKCISIPLFYIAGLSGTLSVLFFSSGINKFANISRIVAKSLITILGFQLFLVYFCWYQLGTLEKSCIYSALLSFPILIICVYVHKKIEKCFPFVLGK